MTVPGEIRLALDTACVVLLALCRAGQIRREGLRMPLTTPPSLSNDVSSA